MNNIIINRPISVFFCLIFGMAAMANCGKLKHASPEKCGFDATLEIAIDSIAADGIRNKAFPGCQVVVVKDGKIAIDKAYGRIDYLPDSRKVDRSTLYDIASMTKAVATVPGLMLAFDDGLFCIDDTVSNYLPQLRGTDKECLTVRELLYHESGLPPTVNTYALMVDSASFTGRLLQYKYAEPYIIKVDKNVYANKNARLSTDLFRKFPSREYDIEVARGIFGGDRMVARIKNAIYNSPVKEKKYVYSCLNFCILKDMEEALTGISHERLLNDRVFKAIGMKHTCFRPSDNKMDMNNIAPTENDSFLRKQHLRGFVHDEIAAYLGGISGNAGLFSTAEDVAKFCQILLNGGTYGDEIIFDSETVETFTSEVSPKSGRGLGFDRAARNRTMQGIGLPETVYGHTGFTGTCFWIDPENDIIVVFLSNRINPSRDNAAWQKSDPRNAVLKAVYDSLRHRQPTS